MKRLFTILITLTLLLGLTACGQVETQSNPGQSQTQQEGISSKEESSTRKVVSFLPMDCGVWFDENDRRGAIKNTAFSVPIRN